MGLRCPNALTALATAVQIQMGEVFYFILFFIFELFIFRVNVTGVS